MTRCLSAEGRPASTVRDLLSGLVRRGAVLYRSPGRRPASPPGNLAFEPHDYLTNYWLGLLASHARRFDEARDAACRAYKVSGSHQALAALGFVEARSGLLRRPRRYSSPLRIPTTDTSRDQVSARFTSRWAVSIARLESGAVCSGGRRLGTELGSPRPALECLAGKGRGHLTGRSALDGQRIEVTPPLVRRKRPHQS